MSTDSSDLACRVITSRASSAILLAGDTSRATTTAESRASNTPAGG
ncbi:unnamed protein product [Ectocarpus sp. 13 AM-2016]